MDNEKYCPNCGTKNQPYAAVCVDCGQSFVTPPESPLPATALPSEVERPSEAGALSAPSEPRFKTRYVLYAALVAVALIVAVGAIAVSQQVTNRAVVTPTAQAPAIAATTAPPESTAATTTSSAATTKSQVQTTPGVASSPAPTSQPSATDYATRLNTVGLGAGLVTVSPFQQTTINGRLAYAGTLISNGQTYQTQVYPTSSYADALAFKSQLVTAYTSQGYTPYTPSQGTVDINIWYGLSGNTLVSISATPTSQINSPTTVVMTTTIQS